MILAMAEFFGRHHVRRFTYLAFCVSQHAASDRHLRSAKQADVGLRGITASPYFLVSYSGLLFGWHLHGSPDYCNVSFLLSRQLYV